MNVYRIEVGYKEGIFRHSEWLIQAETLSSAVAIAERKIKRSPRRYEKYEVDRVSLVGSLDN
jgi:hypothetical protein